MRNKPGTNMLQSRNRLQFNGIVHALAGRAILACPPSGVGDGAV